MRSIVPRPFPLVLVLLVVIGAITVIETRSSTADTLARFINTDDEAVLENGFLNVGRLKGDQTYALPRNLDPEEQGAVPVWCSLPRRRYARYCQL